ncbi:MAG: hypothetical protein CBR30_07305 [Dictyoglomus sp. NZ13-RE01]|nr:MAG: hypothetical protein CBR30_07305 [Dictyoglomus sp. NZ13-RE01]
MRKLLVLLGIFIFVLFSLSYAQEVTLYGYSEIGVKSEFLKDANGNYTNTLGPVTLQYWNTYFKIKAEPSSWLESYFELKMYPSYLNNYSFTYTWKDDSGNTHTDTFSVNVFYPGIEIQKAHLTAKSSLLNVRVYYKEDATPFDDPLQLNKPGDLPGSSWIWGNGIELSGKVFDTNFLAGINSSDQISYLRLKRALQPLTVGFTAMGTNWGEANKGKSLFAVDATGKVGPVDLKAEGIYGKCVWGPNPEDSEGGMVLYADLSSQVTPMVKVYGTAKKVDLGYMHQFNWFKTDQTQLIPGTSGSAGTYLKVGAVVTPLSNLSVEPIVELINREDTTEKTTKLTGIVTFNPTKQVSLKGTLVNSKVNDNEPSTNITGEVTVTPASNVTLYGKVYYPFGGKPSLYGNATVTPLTNLTLYGAVSADLSGSTTWVFLKPSYKLAKDVTLTGIYQLKKIGDTETHTTYYADLTFNNATIYFGSAPSEEGATQDFVKQIGARISFDF